MYTVKLYNNTGFNVENIPDSATLLGTPSIEKTAVDTVQNYVMTSVRISAIFDDVKNADYCQIGDFYYFIAGVTMTSRDVAVLSLIPDYITSYGISNLNFLDGITVRHHVDDDSFGLYTEDDPLLYCNEPLELEMGNMLFQSTGEPYRLVLSTVNLRAAGDPAVQKDGVTYEDSQGNSVTVPHLPVQGYRSYFNMGGVHTGAPEFEIPGEALFDMGTGATPDTQILSGIQYCRDLAAETAIVACYQIPRTYCYLQPNQNASNVVAQLYGEALVEGCGIYFANPSQMPRNLRVLYGNYNKFGIMSMAGNRMEAKPEEIYNSGSINTTSPRVIMVTDPRPDGKPYFRFEFVNKQTPIDPTSPEGQVIVDLETFWKNVIPGEPWFQIPLVFTTPSGIIQQQKYYDNSRQLADTNFGQSDMSNAAGLLNSGFNLLSSFSSGMGEIKTGYTRGMSPNAIGAHNANPANIQTFSVERGDYSGAVGAGAGYVGSLATKNINANNYGYNRWKDAYNLGLAKSVVVPDVMFPYTNGTIRDFAGNGVVAYKYRPSDKDMILQDKLLTMYGYAVTDKLVHSHFFNRQYFNYVQANSVSIGNNMPQWWKAGIIAQLAGGVRVWHVTPDETHYDNNPIVVNP